jgi:hypothetical protein
VPTPPEELEEVDLAPVNEDEERRVRQLEDEARRLQTDLAHDDKDPGEGGRARSRSRGAGGRDEPDDAGMLVAPMVIQYLRAMQTSDLGQAEAILAQLKSNAKRAKEHVQALMVDEIPPSDLADLPPQLYKGFLRTLLDRL